MARLRLAERVLIFIDWRSHIIWTAAVVDTHYKKIQQLHIFSERRSKTLHAIPAVHGSHHTAFSSNLHSTIGGLSFENWKTGCRLRQPFYSPFRYTNLVRNFRAQWFYSGPIAAVIACLIWNHSKKQQQQGFANHNDVVNVWKKDELVVKKWNKRALNKLIFMVLAILHRGTNSTTTSCRRWQHQLHAFYRFDSRLSNHPRVFDIKQKGWFKNSVYRAFLYTLKQHYEF